MITRRAIEEYAALAGLGDGHSHDCPGYTAGQTCCLLYSAIERELADRLEQVIRRSSPKTTRRGLRCFRARPRHGVDVLLLVAPDGNVVSVQRGYRGGKRTR